MEAVTNNNKNRRSLRALICFLSFTGIQYVSAQSGTWKDQLSTNFILQYRSAIEYKDVSFQKNEFVLKPQLNKDFNKKLRLYFEGRVYAELNDNLEPGKPDQVAISNFSERSLLGDRVDLELRELYFDWYVGPQSTIRVGKQQVVWGETDGLKLLDVVNPQSFREFILDDFEDSRIPLWTIKAEFPLLKHVDAEVVWIPDQTFHFITSPDAPFFPRAVVPRPPEGVSETLSIQKPDRTIGDSEIGLRLSSFLGGWDLTFSYFYHFDDLPNFHLSMQSSQTQRLQINQLYRRMHLLGTTFNNAFGSFVVRGETAINLGRHFSTQELVNGGIASSNQLLNTIGLDWISGEWVASLQLFNDYLLQNINPFNRDDLETNWTLLISRELMNDNLKVETLAIQNLNKGDWLIRPKASYLVSSNLQMDLGADIFLGNYQGLLGQYKDRSRIYFSLELGL